MLFRPYISDSAAIRKGANASPRTKMEKVTCISEDSICKSWAIVDRDGATILAVMMVTSWPIETMMATVILRVEDQLYGS